MNIHKKYWPIDRAPRDGMTIILYLKKGQKIEGHYKNFISRHGHPGWYNDDNKPIGSLVNPVVGWKAKPGRFKEEPIRNIRYPEYDSTSGTCSDSPTYVTLRAFDEINKFNEDYSCIAKKLAKVRSLYVKRTHR